MTITILEVDVAVAARAMRVTQLIGRRVDNDAREHIGSIDDLMLNGDRVVFAILSVGGFLGFGAHFIAVPFESLQISDDHVILPGATRDELKRLPKFEYL
jgi:sporulation protein YlmC with PRC-barrel domain